MINRTWLEKQNVHIFHPFSIHLQLFFTGSHWKTSAANYDSMGLLHSKYVSLGNDTIPRCRKTFGSSLSTRDCVAKFLFSSEQFITYFGLPNSVCKFPPSLIEMHIRVGAAAVLASLRYWRSGKSLWACESTILDWEITRCFLLT